MEFWQTKTLQEMSPIEWESLCDGCAKCCLQKLEDEETTEVFYTSVACKLLDLESCQCSDYQNRNTLVPTCIWLNVEAAASLSWLPKTCAYRVLSEGGDLPSWHPLVSKQKDSVFDAGVAIRSFAHLETGDEDLESYIIEGFI